MFARSVILMLDHNDEGAMGVIVNQPINTTVTDLAGRIFEEDFEWNKPLHLGGPVPGLADRAPHAGRAGRPRDHSGGLRHPRGRRPFSKSFANAWNHRW